MHISEFIELSDQSEDIALLFNMLVNAANAYGFDRIAYGVLNYHEQLRVDSPPPAVMLNYPTEWRTHYFKQNYQAIDPIILLSPVSAKPYIWGQLDQRFGLTNRQQLLMNEARENGLIDGVSVPLHGPLGRAAVVSFASSAGGVACGRAVGHLNALATQFHLRFNDLVLSDQPMQPEPTWLSQREKDCLLWAAQGKSSWDIGVILGISENTVNFHLKNTMRKLGTSGRTLTVLRALQMKLIDLSQVA